MAMASFALLMCALPGSTRSVYAQQSSTPSPTPAMPGNLPDVDAHLAEDFKGLTFTDDQKTQIDQIRQDMGKRKAIVSKDAKLTQDQRDAMMQGYSRLEYGQIYKVLTPEQRREVHRNSAARQAASQPGPRKPHPPS
jgi:Spy/CpxP family protein refolding chaperone